MAARVDGDNLRWERERLQGLIRRLRIEAGHRQQDLADRLSVPQSFVSTVERGERRIDVSELRRLCRALGISLAVFVAHREAARGDGGRT